MDYYKTPLTYAVKNKQNSVREKSRSGGFFTAVSDVILEEKGVVYGCILTEKLEAKHIRTNMMDERDEMRGSKYIQSKLGDTYINVKKDLLDGINVLFTGTSCQVAGLKSFLGKDYKNLFCVDIVCHGVPSFKIWKNYLEWQEKNIGIKIVNANFRNKSDFGWRAHIETLECENGKKKDDYVFRNLFLGCNVLRPSCYECKYKRINHPGDITIADYWGIEKISPDFDDNKGVSLVLINNEKGREIFKKTEKELIFFETNIEASMQPALKGPFPAPEEREQFWKDFENKGFGYIAKKYAKDTIVKNMKIRFKSVRHKFNKRG